MPSTFSPELGLELMQTGEDTSTWGTKTNSNMSIIDSRFGATLAISVAGNSDVTLNATQAENFTHELTGVLTGNINYIFPAQGGIYFIENNTTGAFTVTVKATGGTGVNVPQGNNRLIVLDSSSAIAYLAAAGSGKNSDITTMTAVTNLGTNPIIAGQIDTTTVTGSGYGTRIRAPDGSHPGILQFTNTAANTQLGSIAVDNSGVVTIGGAGSTAINLSWALPVASGGTGGTTASAARSALSAAASGANSDITSLLGIPNATISNSGGNVLSLANNLGAQIVNLAGNAYEPLLCLPGASANQAVTFDQFVVSLTNSNQNGEFTLPGGLKIKMGYSTTTIAAGGGTQIITFVNNFTTTQLYANIAIQAFSVNDQCVVPKIGIGSLSSFTVTNNDVDSGITQWRWFSIGI